MSKKDNFLKKSTWSFFSPVPGKKKLMQGSRDNRCNISFCTVFAASLLIAWNWPNLNSRMWVKWCSSMWWDSMWCDASFSGVTVSNWGELPVIANMYLVLLKLSHCLTSLETKAARRTGMKQRRWCGCGCLPAPGWPGMGSGWWAQPATVTQI